MCNQLFTCHLLNGNIFINEIWEILPMNEIMEITEKMLWLYTGDCWYFLIFLVCAGYLFSKNKARSEIRFINHYMIGIGFIYICPVTAKIIMDYCIGKSVYWRMFWLLPMAMVVALAVTFIASEMDSKVHKNLFVLAILLLLIFSGNFMYSKDVFTKSVNAYKLPEDIFSVCDMIEDHAENNRITAVFPTEFLPYVRQYDANIYLPYGRRVETETSPSSDARKLFDVMNQTDKSAEELAQLAKQNGCQYIVVSKEDAVNNNLSDGDFKAVADSGNYIIYYDTAN